MSDPRITIKFRADGAAALQKAIRALAVEQKRLEKGNAAAARMQKKLNRQIDEYNKIGIFGVRNTRNLSFSLSVLRSKLLICFWICNYKQKFRFICKSARRTRAFREKIRTSLRRCQ